MLMTALLNLNKPKPVDITSNICKSFSLSLLNRINLGFYELTINVCKS